MAKKEIPIEDIVYGADIHANLAYVTLRRAMGSAGNEREFDREVACHSYSELGEYLENNISGKGPLMHRQYSEIPEQLRPHALQYALGSSAANGIHQPVEPRRTVEQARAEHTKDGQDLRGKLLVKVSHLVRDLIANGQTEIIMMNLNRMRESPLYEILF